MSAPPSPSTTGAAIVLVRPERAANVGSVARAMKNFGLSDLRLVASRTGLAGDDGHGEARALAWNAQDVLDGARSFATLEEAVGEFGLVAAATARRSTADSTPRDFAAEVERLPAGSRAACVFGPEDHGLSNLELDLCRARLTIPTSAAQPSLNLAQAVVIVAYELALVGPVGAPSPEADGEPAREEQVQRLSDAARDLLVRAGYLNAQAPEHVLGELRRLLGRARPTAREVTLLQGLVAQLDWARRTDVGR